jgi:ATP-dependent RNA helicase RhlE
LSSAIAHSEADSAFDRFRLDSNLTDALCEAGFRTPRPIQDATIPACLAGRDVMGLAQTGTGKTAAFALPILQRLLASDPGATRALILAPTRELAKQIEQEIRTLARFVDVSTLTLFGGIPIRPQMNKLRRHPDIVVGCPGRVLDLLQQGAFDVSKVETLVLDEADHMFDMGFIRDVKKIVSRLPRRRQNLLFSATMPKEVRALANEMLDNPVVVELATSAPAERVEHYIVRTREDEKRDLLAGVLDADDCQTAIVFMRTKHRAKRMAEQLAKRGLRAVALQGNMSQAQRDRAMAGFREGRFDVLVATDIAARGLDVAGVDYVVNYDVPNTSEAYTHRIGRTGRSEASGKACTFVTDADRAWLRSTERLLGEPITDHTAPGRTSHATAPTRAPRAGGPDKIRPLAKVGSRGRDERTDERRPRRRRSRRVRR